MSSSTIAGAVAKRDAGAEAQIRAYRSDFATVLPSHIKPDTWVRVAQGLLRRDRKLRAAAEANVGSFLAALLDCARLGLEPGETYHLVPFGKEIVGIEDYKGLIELIYRAGAVSSVKAEIVYANDEYVYDSDTMSRPRHKPAGVTCDTPNWFATREQRGAMVGAYCYCEMKDGGTSRVVQMARWEIEEHKAVSKTAHLPDSMWIKWPRSAWLKTVVKEQAKWVPSSPEYITHKLRAERLDQAPSPELSEAARALPEPARDVSDLPEVPAIDGEVVEPEAAARITERQSKQLHAILTKGEINRETKLAILTHITKREIATSDDLTEVEATEVIRQLRELERLNIPLVEAVIELIDRPAGGES